ncbi:MAG: hypothetical protein A2057_11005 [Ignavibacteria bacterium GWA2_35_9]|nr:MAG: hypothetical protein A2057_11005 [Ignavibacteria bacterium GWA2_35_9]OGU49401.1 MAG: hypothetical protein A2080_11340 [Ignavibacteria bacterium GWC2_36_12]
MTNISTDSEYEELLKKEKEIDSGKSKFNKQIKFYLVIAFSLIIIGLITFSGFFFGDPAYLSQLGEYVGGIVASTWSLAGLIIIYVAFLGQKLQLLEQQKELVYNRFEVQATRKELAGQRLQMEEQNKTLRMQRFENTYFQMLNQLNNITSETKIMLRSVVYSGREAFGKFYTFLKENSENYDYWMLNEQHEFEHYFRNLLSIIIFIDDSKDIDKMFYIRLLLAQISKGEMLFLYYYCIVDKNIYKDQFQEKVQKYGLFYRLLSDDLIDRSHFNYYHSSAFRLADS